MRRINVIITNEMIMHISRLRLRYGRITPMGIKMIRFLIIMVPMSGLTAFLNIIRNPDRLMYGRKAST
jgi:hypothetical protein